VLPEWALLVVGLLWGPAAVWLLYRSLRGRSGGRMANRRPGGESETTPVWPAGLRVDLVLGVKYWACRRCRSFNRSGSSRCSSCGADVTSGIPIGEVGVGVPVMAPNLHPHSERVADDWAAPSHAPTTEPSAAENGRTAVPAARADATALLPPANMTAVQVQSAAMTAARSVGDDGRGIGRVAAPPAPLAPSPWSLPGAPDGRRAAAAPTHDQAEVATAMPGTPLACPYLGIYDDPPTRYDFAHPANACHAGVDVARVSGWRQRVGLRAGGDRPTAVSAEHQTRLCLTADHVQCPRYPRATGTPPATQL
jgi:hypothetical protein